MPRKRNLDSGTSEQKKRALVPGDEHIYGEGSTFVRKDGRVCAAVCLPDGGRKYLYLRKGEGDRDFLKRIEKARNSAEQYLPIPPDRLTVGQFLDQWYEITAPTLTSNTRASYRGRLARIKPFLARRRLIALNAMEIQAAVSALSGRFSPSTIRGSRALIHRALNDAVSWGLLPRNPADAVKSPPIPKKPLQILTRDQVQQLIRETKGHHYHALWVLMVTTGLRLGEATGLRWRDVDLRVGRLAVQVSLGRIPGEGMSLADTKTSSSRRVVELAPDVATLLRQHRVQQGKQRLSMGPAWRSTDDLVFTNLAGAPIDPANIHKVWDRTLRRLGLPTVNPHDLRHTAASLLLGRNVHPKKVQEMLGHSSIRTTIDLYSHLMPSMHSQVADEMQSLFETPSETASGTPSEAN